MDDKNVGRVILLGLDGMDYDLTQELISQGHLPNLKAIADKGGFSPLLSVFPPDSIPAWITTFTGIDPSNHGVLDHVNYLLDDFDECPIDTSVFHEKTFWDRIGNETDKKVCIVNPFMAYPVWPVNGVMVSGPVFIEGNIECSDESYLKGNKIPDSIGGIAVFPNKTNMKPYYDDTVRDTKEQVEFGINLLKDNEFDFFFQTIVTTDRVQHHYWRYCDKKDPTYPGPSEIDTTVTDFFKLTDDIVGQFLNELNDEDVLLVMSDHGHGMRCTHCFNTNEFLRQKGYLKSSSGKKKFSKKIILEKLKNRVLRFMNDHDLEDYISVIAKFVPNAKAMKKGSHITNYAESMAYGSDFAGTNPFGGICINRDNVNDYESFRNTLMSELSEIEDNGEKIFTWIKKREELYSGELIDRYPDILYEMLPKYGSGFSLHSDLITINPTHKKISGGHKKNGIFFINRTNDWDINKKECKITNVYKTILSLYGLSDNNQETSSFVVKK
ncbi:MAG: alkaline phosphatase family protein [Gammaproteobacteria bacterium]|nr:alkaline phosphatase family protein [Gammaproteobacteria bacterium]